jgi:hypothetical protein
VNMGGEMLGTCQILHSPTTLKRRYVHSII